jgi:hypothetical protein
MEALWTPETLATLLTSTRCKDPRVESTLIMNHGENPFLTARKALNAVSVPSQARAEAEEARSIITCDIRHTTVYYREGRLGGSAVELWAGGARFESQLGHRLFWLEVCGSPQSLLADPKITPTLCHDRFLPHPFQLIIHCHPIIRHSISSLNYRQRR